MSVCSGDGGLCNQLIRNLSFSIIAEKFDLSVEYKGNGCENVNKKFLRDIEELGIKIYNGNKKYKEMKILTQKNYLEILNKENINFNLSMEKRSFQSNDIANLLYKYGGMCLPISTIV